MATVAFNESGVSADSHGAHDAHSAAVSDAPQAAPGGSTLDASARQMHAAWQAQSMYASQQQQPAGASYFGFPYGYAAPATDGSGAMQMPLQYVPAPHMYPMSIMPMGMAPAMMIPMMPAAGAAGHMLPHHHGGIPLASVAGVSSATSMMHASSAADAAGSPVRTSAPAGGGGSTTPSPPSDAAGRDRSTGAAAKQRVHRRAGKRRSGSGMDTMTGSVASSQQSATSSRRRKPRASETDDDTLNELDELDMGSFEEPERDVELDHVSVSAHSMAGSATPDAGKLSARSKDTHKDNTPAAAAARPFIRSSSLDSGGSSSTPSRKKRRSALARETTADAPQGSQNAASRRSPAQARASATTTATGTMQAVHEDDREAAQSSQTLLHDARDERQTSEAVFSAGVSEHTGIDTAPLADGPRRGDDGPSLHVHKRLSSHSTHGRPDDDGVLTLSAARVPTAPSVGASRAAGGGEPAPSPYKHSGPYEGDFNHSMGVHTSAAYPYGSGPSHEVAAQQQWAQYAPLQAFAGPPYDYAAASRMRGSAQPWNPSGGHNHGSAGQFAPPAPAYYGSYAPDRRQYEEYGATSYGGGGSAGRGSGAEFARMGGPAPGAHSHTRAAQYSGGFEPDHRYDAVQGQSRALPGPHTRGRGGGRTRSPAQGVQPGHAPPPMPPLPPVAAATASDWYAGASGGDPMVDTHSLPFELPPGFPSLPPRMQLSKLQDKLTKFRSKLCIFFLNSGGFHCPYADRCMYAHGQEQLRLSATALASLQREAELARQREEQRRGRGSFVLPAPPSAADVITVQQTAHTGTSDGHALSRATLPVALAAPAARGQDHGSAVASHSNSSDGIASAHTHTVRPALLTTSLLSVAASATRSTTNDVASPPSPAHSSVSATSRSFSRAQQKRSSTANPASVRVCKQWLDSNGRYCSSGDACRYLHAGAGPYNVDESGFSPEALAPARGGVSSGSRNTVVDGSAYDLASMAAAAGVNLAREIYTMPSGERLEVVHVTEEQYMNLEAQGMVPPSLHSHVHARSEERDARDTVQHGAVPAAVSTAASTSSGGTSSPSNRRRPLPIAVPPPPPTTSLMQTHARAQARGGVTTAATMTGAAPPMLVSPSSAAVRPSPHSVRSSASIVAEALEAASELLSRTPPAGSAFAPAVGERVETARGPPAPSSVFAAARSTVNSGGIAMYNADANLVFTPSNYASPHSSHAASYFPDVAPSLHASATGGRSQGSGTSVLTPPDGRPPIPGTSGGARPLGPGTFRRAQSDRGIISAAARGSSLLSGMGASDAAHPHDATSSDVLAQRLAAAASLFARQSKPYGAPVPSPATSGAASMAAYGFNDAFTSGGGGPPPQLSALPPADPHTPSPMSVSASTDATHTSHTSSPLVTGLGSGLTPSRGIFIGSHGSDPSPSSSITGGAAADTTHASAADPIMSIVRRMSLQGHGTSPAGPNGAGSLLLQSTASPRTTAGNARAAPASPAAAAFNASPAGLSVNVSSPAAPGAPASRLSARGPPPGLAFQHTKE